MKNPDFQEEIALESMKLVKTFLMIGRMEQQCLTTVLITEIRKNNVFAKFVIDKLWNRLNAILLRI